MPKKKRKKRPGQKLISARIGQLRSEGYKGKQASAIAYREGRSAGLKLPKLKAKKKR